MIDEEQRAAVIVVLDEPYFRVLAAMAAQSDYSDPAEYAAQVLMTVIESCARNKSAPQATLLFLPKATEIMELRRQGRGAELLDDVKQAATSGTYVNWERVHMALSAMSLPSEWQR